MGEEPTTVERVLDVIDGFRGLLGLLLVVGVAVAALRAGGIAGWVLGVVLLALCATGVVVVVRRRA